MASLGHSANTNVLSKRVGFIGAGNMARAIASGMLHNSLIAADRLWVSAPTEANMAQWRQWGATATTDNAVVIDTCDVVFLAVKPHLLDTALSTCRDTPIERQKAVAAGGVLFVSVMAGLSTERVTAALCRQLGVTGACVIRTAPSTPCQLQAGCCCYCLPPAAAAAADAEQLQQHSQLVELVFDALGRCVRVDESLMDVCCAAFSSGVAFILTVIDALAAAAVRGGVPWTEARALAAQTVVGAGQMALQSTSHPCQLRDSVSSPGGTTIAGLEALEGAGVRGAIMAAVAAATRRGEELSRK